MLTVIVVLGVSWDGPSKVYSVADPVETYVTVFGVSKDDLNLLIYYTGRGGLRINSRRSLTVRFRKDEERESEFFMQFLRVVKLDFSVQYRKV